MKKKDVDACIVRRTVFVRNNAGVLNAHHGRLFTLTLVLDLVCSVRSVFCVRNYRLAKRLEKR